MKRPLTTLAILAMLSLPAADVMAQGYGPGTTGGPGPMRMQAGGPGMMMAQTGAYLPDSATLPALKDKLAITQQQEPLWTAYCSSVEKLRELRQAMHANPPAATSPEELQKSRQTRHDAAIKAHTRTSRARDKLAAALTPEQRAIFDKEAPAMPVRMPR